MKFWESFDHLRPEFRGDMLGDERMGGLDLREVRHGGDLQVLIIVKTGRGLEGADWAWSE